MIAAAGAKEPCDGKVLPTADKDRGKDYNHSTFLDIIIAGLVGLRAAFGKLLVVEPLADKSVTYFALDNLAYHGVSAQQQSQAMARLLVIARPLLRGCL